MCLFGCNSSSGGSTASQGANQPPQSGGTASASNGGPCVSCCPSFNIRSQTIATQPGSRTRTNIDIGEEVDLSTDPSTSVTWSIDSDDGHKGTLSQSSGSTTRYTACDRAKSVTIKGRNSCGNEATITFTVVEPSSGRFHTETDISQITSTTINVGFQASPTMMPQNVSFYNCEMREGVYTSTSSGPLAYRPEVQHRDTGSWVAFSSTVGSDGTVLSAPDTVSTNIQPLSRFPAGGTTDGRFLWPIPWRAQVRGGGTNGQIVFDTLNHLMTYTASSRNLKVSKGNRNPDRRMPELPTHGCLCCGRSHNGASADQL